MFLQQTRYKRSFFVGLTAVGIGRPDIRLFTATRTHLMVVDAGADKQVIIYDSAYAPFIQDPDKPKTIYECEGAKQVRQSHSMSLLLHGNLRQVVLRCDFSAQLRPHPCPSLVASPVSSFLICVLSARIASGSCVLCTRARLWSRLSA